MSFFSGFDLPGSPGYRRREEFRTHEEFVRANWRRPGVVADGVTLVDLYDRIAALEARIRELEQRAK
ncbi:hypothetical protein ACTJI8_17675 [Microbacterium sp. 22303]|uniref:hypothetical protein n=1 Tax=Microbacterium sp. 22303 TaxID=3453905 RepID=UPI003F828804